MKIYFRLLLFFLFFFPKLILMAQEQGYINSDKSVIDSLILNSALQEVEQFFFLDDSIDKNISADLTELEKGEYSTFSKDRYLNLIRRINLLKNYPAEQVEETYSGFLKFSSSFDFDEAGNNSSEAFQKYKNCLTECSIQDAAKYFLIAVFFRIKFLQHYRIEFERIIQSIKSDVNNDNFAGALQKKSTLDSTYSLIPYPEYKITYEYEAAKRQLNKIAEKMMYMQDYYPQKYSFNFGLLTLHQFEKSYSFTDYYAGGNPLLFDERYQYEYKLPFKIGLGFSLDFNYRIYSTIYLGIDMKYFYYQYDMIPLNVDREVPRYPGLKHRYSFDFKDLSVNSISYHINITYKIFEQAAIHPLFKLGFGAIYMNRKSTLLEDENVFKMFYNEKINKTLYRYEGMFKELEVGLGIEVFPYMSNRFLTTLLFSKGIQLDKLTLPERFPVNIKLMIGYSWE